MAIKYPIYWCVCVIQISHYVKNGLPCGDADPEWHIRRQCLYAVPMRLYSSHRSSIFRLKVAPDHNLHWTSAPTSLWVSPQWSRQSVLWLCRRKKQQANEEHTWFNAKDVSLNWPWYPVNQRHDWCGVTSKTTKIKENSIHKVTSANHVEWGIVGKMSYKFRSIKNIIV